jgi:hypothetical protein
MLKAPSALHLTSTTAATMPSTRTPTRRADVRAVSVDTVTPPAVGKTSAPTGAEICKPSAHFRRQGFGAEDGGSGGEREDEGHRNVQREVEASYLRRMGDAKPAESDYCMRMTTKRERAIYIANFQTTESQQPSNEDEKKRGGRGRCYRKSRLIWQGHARDISRY